MSHSSYSLKMIKSLILYLLFSIFQTFAYAIGHLGFHSYDNHADPRFLNSDYQFKGLGLFKPHIGESKIVEDSFIENKKGLTGDHFIIGHGVAGEDVKHGDLGIYKGEGALKNINGESEYFVDSDGGKKEHLDGKNYYGGQHFGTEEQSEDEKAVKQGHRKGHKVNGFSTSHHNDESGKTEEFYDEEHDEAGNEAFVGKAEAIGESGKVTVKGEHQDGEFKAGEVKKGIHFDKGSGLKEIRKDEKHFGERKFGENGKSFGEHKVLGEGGFSGYSGSNKFLKHHPDFYF